MMTVLIGGGTGLIGRSLTQLLQKKGYEVTIISRTAGAGKMTWTDLDKQGLPDNCVAVVNLAGNLVLDPLKRWNDDTKAELRNSRVDPTRQLVKAIMAAKHKPKVWVSSSATGYYQPSATAEYTEASHGGDSNFLAQLCEAWEKAATLPDNAATRHVTIRIGVVLGRDGGMAKGMYLPFYLGLGGRIGSGTQWFPWIHVHDMVGIIAHAIENDHVSGVLNGVAPSTVTNADFTREFASAMCRPAILPIPGFLLNWIFGPERAMIMLEGQRVIPKRTLELGYTFIYPDLKSACVQCVSWQDVNM